MDALEVMNRFGRDADGAGSVALGGLTVNLGERERAIGYRHVESVLPIDAPVYVLGGAQEDGEISVPPGGGEGRFLISYRSEEQLEKFMRDALLPSLIALGLFVFGAIFLAVGVAAARGVF